MPSISLDEVNMSERRREVLRSVLNTTANAVCYIHWHYSVVGVTVTMALLERSSVPLERRPAPLQNYSKREVHWERGASLRRAHGVYLACCIVVDR